MVNFPLFFTTPLRTPFPLGSGINDFSITSNVGGGRVVVDVVVVVVVVVEIVVAVADVEVVLVVEVVVIEIVVGLIVCTNGFGSVESIVPAPSESIGPRTFSDSITHPLIMIIKSKNKICFFIFPHY